MARRKQFPGPAGALQRGALLALSVVVLLAGSLGAAGVLTPGPGPARVRSGPSAQLAMASRPAARPAAGPAVAPASSQTAPAAGTPARRTGPAPAPRVVVARRTAGGKAAARKGHRAIRSFGPGYQLAAADGGVFAFGNAAFLGSMGAIRLSAPVVAMADTPDGRGYWEAAADGGVFAFGTARYYGGLAGRHLSAPIVGMAATTDGGGYWLVGSDGGVFTYGNARYLGGMAGHRLSAPVVGMAATPDGGGYWLVSADGGVFTYGDARYFGAMAGHRLARPVVGMASTPDGTGYWLVGAGGGVFTYGTAPYLGGMGGDGLASPVVGLAPTPTGQGYWLASADGGIFTYGDAGFWGAPGAFSLNGRVTTLAAGLHPAHRQTPIQVGGRYGFDISWPQCDDRQLPAAHAFAVLGVTGGRALSTNPCLPSEWAWATAAAGASGVYVNLNSPPARLSGPTTRGPAGPCRPTNPACLAYNYGSNTVRAALDYAARSGVTAPMWWLDVEVDAGWSAHRDVNSLVIKGAVDELHRRHLGAGIYSTPLQWSEITGGAGFGVPVWVAGSPALDAAPGYCSAGFNGGPVWMVQTMLSYDVNYLCRPELASDAFGVHPLPAAPAWPLDKLPVSVETELLEG